MDSSTTTVLNLTDNVQESFKIGQNPSKVKKIYGQQDYIELAKHGIAKRGKKATEKKIDCVCSLCKFWGYQD